MTVTIDLSNVISKKDFPLLYEELNNKPHPFVQLREINNDSDAHDDELGDGITGIIQAGFEQLDKAVWGIAITGLTKIILVLIDKHYDQKKVSVKVKDRELEEFSGTDDTLIKTIEYLNKLKEKAENEQ